MAIVEVLQMLASSGSRLSDGLRQASILPEVLADTDLAEWINKELAGYQDDDLPDYRRHKLVTMGNGSNGAWLHNGVTLPVHTFSEEVRKYARETTLLRQGVGSIETLVDQNEGGHAAIPWPPEAVGRVNREIAQGGTGVNSTYLFTEIWRDIPLSIVYQLLERVRQHALAELAKRATPEQLSTRIVRELAARPAEVSVSGAGNQVIISSPGTAATLTVAAGDGKSLDDALASLGISTDSVAELHGFLDSDEVDQPGKVMKALAWSREAAQMLGINTAGSAAATLILQYLGQVA